MTRTRGHRHSIICLLFLAAALALFSSSYAAYAQFDIASSTVRTNFTYTPPKNVTKDTAFNSLLSSEEIIKEMSGSGLSTTYIGDVLLSAKKAFIGKGVNSLRQDLKTEKDPVRNGYIKSLIDLSYTIPPEEEQQSNYSRVLYLAKLIEFRREQAYRIVDSLSLVGDKETQYAGRNINTTEGLLLIEKARRSFIDERYDEAEAYINEANAVLDRGLLEYNRINALVSFGKSFFAKYWIETLLLVAALILIGYPTVRKVRAILAARKINMLKLEYQSLEGSLKKAQQECYMDRTITEKTYKIREEEYRKRMTEIKYKIPVLESIAKGDKVKGEKREGKAKKKGVLEVK